MLEDALKWIGAGDQALLIMGPVLTIFLAWLFGGCVTQILKFPISRFIDGAWFDWSVRLLSVLVTAVFAHALSNSLNVPMDVGVGAAQPLVYKLGLAAVRKWWPWAEVSLLVGSVAPPISAYKAAADRAANK